jgi:hypothetical protein
VPIYGLQGNPVVAQAGQEFNMSNQWVTPEVATRSVKFGKTAVALPQQSIIRELTPLQPNYADFLRLSHKRSTGILSLAAPSYLPVERKTGRIDLSTSVRDNAYGIFKIAGNAIYQDKPHVKREPRQTKKYWQDERKKHAMTVFGDEESRDDLIEGVLQDQSPPNYL